MSSIKTSSKNRSESVTSFGSIDIQGEETNNNVDTLIYIEGALIWNLRREHYSKSGMNTFIGTPIYKNMTARNVNTVRKLAELMK